MCETFTFYHLCGHVTEKTTSSCCQAIHNRVDKRMNALKLLQSTTSQALCRDTPNNIYLIPSLCKQCGKNGVVGDYFNTHPRAEFDVLRTWKESLQLEKVKAAAADHHAAIGMDGLDDDDRSSAAEDMAFIPVSEVGTSESSRTSPSGSEAALDEHSKELVNDGDIRERIKVLGGRVTSALAKIQTRADQF